MSPKKDHRFQSSESLLRKKKQIKKHLVDNKPVLNFDDTISKMSQNCSRMGAGFKFDRVLVMSTNWGTHCTTAIKAKKKKRLFSLISCHKNSWSNQWPNFRSMLQFLGSVTNFRGSYTHIFGKKILSAMPECMYIRRQLSMPVSCASRKSAFISWKCTHVVY